jgi:putative acetyltransferase
MTPPSAPFRLTIREACLDDVHAVKAVHKAAVWQLCADDYTPDHLAAWTQSDDTPALPHALRPDSDAKMWAAEQDGTIIGFGALEGEQIQAVYVHPDHVRRGVGTRLLRKIEEVVRSQGLAALRMRASLMAVPFYQANGYQVLERCSHCLLEAVEIPCVKMCKQIG